MKNQEKNCCQSIKKESSKTWVKGVLYGILPHSFCIAFIILSVVGSVAMTAYFKKFLLIPNLFLVLVLLSFVLATISSLIYLKKNNCFCLSGIKDKWKYITILYSTTILTNLLIFFVAIPFAVNTSSLRSNIQDDKSVDLSLAVEIPCSGHASLIVDELKRNPAVQSIKYNLPDNFQVKYNPEETSPDKIIGIEVFNTYPAVILN